MYRNHHYPSVAPYLALVLALLAGTSAQAEERKIIPSISLKGEYTDNLMFSSTNPLETFVGTITPALDLGYRSERLDSGLKLTWNGLIYSNAEELNALEQKYAGRLKYRLLPGLSLSTDAAYAHESRPDREIESTGLATSYRSHRQTYGLGADYTLNELTTITGSYGYDQIDYSTGRLASSRTHQANLILTRNLEQQLSSTSGRLILGYSHSDYQTQTMDSHTLAVGLSRQLHELWNLSGELGVRYTAADFSSGGSRDNWGWIANLSLGYQDEMNSGSLTFSRSVQSALGRVGATERTSVTGRASRRFNYELSGNLSLGYHLNQSDNIFSSDTIDEDTVVVNPSVTYAFNRDLNLEGGYRYTFVANNTTSSDASKHSIWVGLTSRFPLFE